MTIKWTASLPKWRAGWCRFRDGEPFLVEFLERPHNLTGRNMQMFRGPFLCDGSFAVRCGYCFGPALPSPEECAAFARKPEAADALIAAEEGEGNK